MTGKPITPAVLAELRGIFDDSTGPVPRQLVRRLFDALDACAAGPWREATKATEDDALAWRPPLVGQPRTTLAWNLCGSRLFIVYYRDSAPPLIAEVRRPEDG